MVNIPLLTGFYTSQVVVWDFWTINSIIVTLHPFLELHNSAWSLATISSSRQPTLTALPQPWWNFYKYDEGLNTGIGFWAKREAFSRISQLSGMEAHRPTTQQAASIFGGFRSRCLVDVFPPQKWVFWKYYRKTLQKWMKALKGLKPH